MNANDARREEARARLHARLGVLHEADDSSRVTCSIYDERRKFKNSETDKRVCEVGRNHSREDNKSRSDLHLSVGRNARSRNPQSSIVSNVAAPSPRSRKQGVIVGRDTRGGWTASSYRSDATGFAGIFSFIGSLFGSGFRAATSMFETLAGFITRFLPTRFLVLLVAVALLVFACFKLVPGLFGESESPSSGESLSGEVDHSALSLEALVAEFGEEDGSALFVAARYDGDQCWVASHLDEYDQLDKSTVSQLMSLFAEDWASAGFVRSLADESYTPEVTEYDGVGLGSVGGFPILCQWDDRWGANAYDGGVIGLKGSGPTALSIVYQGVTGKSDMSPAVMAEYATNNGYVSASNGPNLSLITEGASSLGLAAAEIDVAEDNLIWTLESDVPVIALVGPGDFTGSEHCLVLVGMDSEGKVLVIDPYSSDNTAKTWDVSTIVSQSKNLVAYYA